MKLNKIKMFGILLIAIGGAVLIYTHFDKKRSQQIEINKFNQTLSRLGLDVSDGSNVDIKRNYMSPQIILKMYQEKIAEQEKSRKDKEFYQCFT